MIFLKKHTIPVGAPDKFSVVTNPNFKEGMVIIAAINIRMPLPHELENLHKIWRSCFSDEDKSLFFSFFYKPELCKVVICDDAPVAMGFLIPVGNLVDSLRQKHPCAFVYALATLPQFRGRGFACGIVEALIREGVSRGYTAIALRPSEDSLFEYYNKNSPFREWFYCAESLFDFTDIGIAGSRPKQTGKTPASVELCKISAEKYADLRNDILREHMPNGSCYVEMSAHALRYQEKICKIYGGGLYCAKLSGGFAGGGFAVAAVELHSDNVVTIKELLAPANPVSGKAGIISAISQIFPARQYITRCPVVDFQNSAASKRFAMLAALPGITDAGPLSQTSAPWCGLAFD